MNPIAFTEQIGADFLRYQLTTYPLADIDLHAQMRAIPRLETPRDTGDWHYGKVASGTSLPTADLTATFP